MKKFILKYLIIFVSMISFLFFSLIFMQECGMKRMRPDQPDIENFSAPPRMMMPEEPDEEPPMSIPLIFIFLFSSGFVYMILKYIDKNFVTPIILIEENVKKIKEGNLEVEFKVKTENKDVEETFSTLNEMVQGLKQKEKLEDAFVQNLVHDLRTPVIAQERAMSILSEELKDNPIVDGIIQNNDAYLKIINYIIEAFSEKEINIKKQDVKLYDVVETVIEALKLAADKKNIKIENLIQKDFTLFVDYLSINRIILNLTSNAIENIDENKIIKIKAENMPDKTTIVIEDNGQGIEEDVIKTLFTKYVSKKRGGKKSVSGLGLSIVKTLVNKNGGEITVESEISKYTKFIIELPNKERTNEI